MDAIRHSKFTFAPSPAREAFPVWSPNGLTVGFTKYGTEKPGVYSQTSIGAGVEEFLAAPSPPVTFNGITDWSHDGRFLLIDVNDPKTGGGAPDVWVLSLSDRKTFPFLNSNHSERLASFSPNGRWVAYQSNESGRAEVYIRPFPIRPGQQTVSGGGGAQPRWRDDGKELYFVGPDAKLMAATIEESGGSIEVGTPVPLFQTKIFLLGTDNPARGQYDVSRDGRFLINTVTSEAATVPIVVVQNWTPDSQR
jgi:Tol biopolymer transport system component